MARRKTIKVKKYRRKGKPVKAHKRTIKYGVPKRDGSGRGRRANKGRNPACSPPYKVRKSGFFGPSKYDEMDELEQMSEKEIKGYGLQAQKEDTGEVESSTQFIQKKYAKDELPDKTRSSHWQAYGEGKHWKLGGEEE